MFPNKYLETGEVLTTIFLCMYCGFIDKNLNIFSPAFCNMVPFQWPYWIIIENNHQHSNYLIFGAHCSCYFYGIGGSHILNKMDRTMYRQGWDSNNSDLFRRIGSSDNHLGANGFTLMISWAHLPTRCTDLYPLS